MDVSKINFTFCLTICLVLLLPSLSGCQTDSPFERHPGLFQKPFEVESTGSFRIENYRTTGRARYPYSIVEVDGREIPLKESHIRYANICSECPKTGSEAIGFQLFSSDEKLRGNWVLQIKNNEQKYFHITNSNGVESVWRGKVFGDFDADLGKCVPDDCESYSSLIP